MTEKVTPAGGIQWVKENILKPLDLKNTHFSIHDVDMNRVMGGYYVGIEEDIKYTDYSSMLATAEDVGIFLRALNDGTLLTPKELEIYASIYEFEHTGLIPGYQSMAKYYKDIDAVVIQFTNTTDFNGYHWNVSQVLQHRIVKIIRKSAKD